MSLFFILSFFYIAQGADDGGTSSDPLVEIFIGKAKYKTATIEKTLEPKWNERLEY